MRGQMHRGVRLRDSQCGLFATGKVCFAGLVSRSYYDKLPFEDEAFERGVRDFYLFAMWCGFLKISVFFKLGQGHLILVDDVQ